MWTQFKTIRFLVNLWIARPVFFINLIPGQTWGSILEKPQDSELDLARISP